MWESGSSAGRWIYTQRDLVFAGCTLCGNLVPLQVAGYTLRGIWYELDTVWESGILCAIYCPFQHSLTFLPSDLLSTQRD